LVISARLGEFEAGFERGGQTREHARLAKTLGIRHLIIAINKMDDRDWSKEVYDDMVKKLNDFLRKECQWGPKELTFLPISAFVGINLIDPMPADICSWYQGPSLIQILDQMKPPERDEKAPLRIPVIDRQKEMGLVHIMGKVESGTVSKGQTLMLMPNKATFKVSQVSIDDRLVNTAGSGENVRIGVSGIEESDVSTGNILCDPAQPVPVVNEFLAQLVIVELLQTNPLFMAGFEAVMHIHTSVRDVTVIDLISEIDKKTRKPSKKKPTFVKSGAVVVAKLSSTPAVCLELFEQYQQLGRFTLRSSGKTIAIGKVVQIIA